MVLQNWVATIRLSMKRLIETAFMTLLAKRHTMERHTNDCWQYGSWNVLGEPWNRLTQNTKLFKRLRKVTQYTKSSQWDVPNQVRMKMLMSAVMARDTTAICARAANNHWDIQGYTTLLCETLTLNWTEYPCDTTIKMFLQSSSSDRKRTSCCDTDHMKNEVSQKDLYPVNNLYWKAFQYRPYSLADISSTYEESFMKSVSKLEQTCGDQMRSNAFDSFDPASIISCSSTFKLVCDTNGNHGKTAMWLFFLIMTKPVAATLITQISMSSMLGMQWKKES